jgi:GDP-L-fucose synthase
MYVKVLVAGSSGMVGTSVVNALKQNLEEVSTLNRNDADLLNLQDTSEFLSEKSPDAIVIAAARVGGIRANDEYPVDFLMENLQIQMNIMRAAHKLKIARLVFIGSSCIYPRDCPQPIREEYLMTGPLEKTNSSYAVAKIAGIQMIHAYRKQFGYNWISLMPTNLYGPHDNFNLKESHVLPALIRKFLEAKESNSDKVTLWGSGSALREFLHVSDFSQALLLSLSKYDSELHLNVGTGIEISIKDLAAKIARLTKYEGFIEWDLTKPDGTPRKVLDVSRIKELGWKPAISLDHGIESTIAWYRQANASGGVRK